MRHSLAPLAVFAYNRPFHTRRVIEALRENSLAPRTDLYVFSDAPKSADMEPRVNEVREYLQRVKGFRSLTIQRRETNAGLARSIIEGVSQILAAHDRVIVMEDDLVTSPWFLAYMNNGLDAYADIQRVASIHGYCYPVRRSLPETFFLRGGDCWGWATWRRAWATFEQDGAVLLSALKARRLLSTFDLDGAYSFSGMLRDQVAGRNDSWAVRWHASCFLQDMLTLYPGCSLVHNIGNDASGTHSADVDDYATAVADSPVRVERIEVVESEQARAAFAEFLRGTRGNLLQRAVAGLSRQLRSLR